LTRLFTYQTFNDNIFFCPKLKKSIKCIYSNKKLRKVNIQHYLATTYNVSAKLIDILDGCLFL